MKSFNRFNLLAGTLGPRIGRGPTFMQTLRYGAAALVILVFGACRSAAQPDNDAFTHRLPLAGTNVLFAAYLLDATIEPGEPDHGLPLESAESSVWWTWTAPANGVLEIVPADSRNVGIGMALYRGLTLASLTRVTNWNVQAGEAYHIAGFQPYLIPPDYGHLRTFQLTFYPPPPNDHFTNSILLEGVNPHFEGWTHGATREPGETAHGAGTLWWHWRAPADGVAQLKTSRDYYYGAVFGVFQGNAVNELKAVPYVYGPQSAPVFDVKAGELYYFVVAGNTAQDYFRFSGQIILSPLKIEAPLSGRVYPTPTNVLVRLSSTIPETAYSWVGIYGSNGYPRIESPSFVTQLVFSNLPAGQYSIRASAWDTNHAINYLSPEVVFRVLLPNDDFANSAVLEGTNITASGDMRRATAEPGEIDANGSLWWQWTAPESGWAIVKSIHGNTPQIQVFRGGQLSELTLMPRRPELAGLGTFAFPVEQGITYHLRATGDALANYPSDFFSLTLAQAQPNDDFGNRAPLSGDRSRLEGLMLLATPEPGEPAQLTNPDFASVWYTWTAPAPGMLVARMVKANEWRDGVAIFSGASLSTLQFLGQSVQVQTGQTYQVALYGNRFFAEPVSAELSFFPPPANDFFENAQLLQGSAGETAGQTVAATAEPAVWNGQYKTVWYQWTAPFNGLLSIAIFSEPNAALYLGSDLNSLTRVDYRSCFEVPGTNGEPDCWFRQFDVQAETTYHILVFSEPFVSTPFTLAYRFDAAPTNDAFASRAPLQGNRCLWSGSNWLASREAGEPVLGQAETGRSLWWQWTAPANGWAWVRVVSTNFSPMVRAYGGSALTNLSPPQMLFGGGPNELWFETQAGSTYTLLVDNDWGDSSGGDFTAALELTTAQVVLSDQDPDFSAPRQVLLELSTSSPELDGELAGAQFYIQNVSNVLGVAYTPPFRVQTSALEAGSFRVFALATNRAGEVRHCAPCDFTLCPANDRFARRQLLRGHTIEVGGTVAGAGREPDEPLHTGATNAPSVWYTWQAPADGKVVLGAISLSWPEWPMFGLGIYTGDNLPGLQPVPFSINTDTWEVRFDAVRGQVFQIAVLGYGDEGFILRLSQATISFISPEDYAVFTGGQPITLEVATTEPPGQLAAIDFLAGDQILASVTAPPYRFLWTNAPPGGLQVAARGRLTGDETNPPVDRIFIGVAPSNDSFTMRQAISGTNVHLLGNTSFARALAGEPLASRAWFTWTAPWSGLLRLMPPTDQPCPYITVFTGSAAGELTTVAVNVDSWNLPAPLAFLVRPGTTYHIAVGSIAGDGDFDVHLDFQSAPANDDFAHRTLLAGSEAHLEGSLAVATVEPGEPPYAYFYGDQPRHSLWWTWVAPEGGTIYLTNLTSGSDAFWFHLDYGFYAGTSLSNLVLLTNINSSMPAPKFRVEAGQSYHLAINAPTDDVDIFTARFVFVPAPANDQFAHREVVTGRQLSVLGSTLGATAEPGEPAHFFDPAQHSVWYSWTAPFSGIVYYQWHLDYPLYYYAAYVGDRVNGLTLISRPPGIFGFSAVQNTTYSIAVDSMSQAPGTFEFSLLLRRDTPPPNDLFADRIQLHEGAASIQGWNHYATREWQEPNHAGRWGGRSVWYAWIPPVSGPAAILVRADECPLLIGVYEGTEMTNLIPVAAIASSSQTGELRFTAQKGHEYVIALDGEGGVTSEFEIQVVLPVIEMPPYLELVQAEQSQWIIMVRNLAGRKVRLESSSDFRQWEPQASYAGGTDEWHWSLPLPPKEDERTHFFRAVIWE
jgi:hypothetical protein